MFKHDDNYYIESINHIRSALNKTKKMQYEYMKINHDKWDNYKAKILVNFNIEIYDIERKLLLKKTEYRLDKTDDKKEIKECKDILVKNNCVINYIKNLETSHHW